ncbi:MAG: DUF1552 domain-containing protein [Myxococcaceae bacterium]
MSRRWKLSRRTLLRGVGASVALPMLEQMLPGRAAHAASPSTRRLVVVFVPNGIYMPQWTPTQTGSEYALSPILQPLAPVKEDVLVVSGLANRPAYPDVPGPHAGGTASVLTARKINFNGRLGNGVSVDQVAARELGKSTHFPSLELGLDSSVSGACDAGYSCAYLCNISWASETMQMSKEINPHAVFARLFGGSGDSAGRDRRRRSILDLVRGDAVRLTEKLGQGDRRRLDEYLTGIRELERRLDRAGFSSCTPGAPPPPVVDLRDHTRSMFDLMTLALRCDLTRVITFMVANGQSSRSFPFLGISGQHHALSHHQNDPTHVAANVAINTWEVEQFAYFVQALKTTTDPAGGNLLDDSIVLFISEMGDPNIHDRMNMPVLVAGRAGGQLTPGRHLRLTTEQPLANLHLSLLNMLGIAVDRFGEDSTAPLTGL